MDEQQEHASDMPAAPTRCGFVAIMGPTNVGKSTLVNALVGAKVSIVTHKVQTTRALIRGISIEGPAQVIFTDTPGIFSPRRRLDRAMVSTAWSGAHDADLVVVVLDAQRGIDESAAAVLTGVSDIHHRRALVLNKVDLVDKPGLLALAAEANQRSAFEQTFMVSALSGDGLAELKGWILDRLPAGPWLYPEDEISDVPTRTLAAEITREKLFLRLHQELPYQLTVETEQWKELGDGSIRIEQTIYVARESQRKIVLGRAGATIREIGAAARKEIGEIVEAKVHLFLFVKVREKWEDDPERYRGMGLEFPKS